MANFKKKKKKKRSSRNRKGKEIEFISVNFYTILLRAKIQDPRSNEKKKKKKKS